MATAPISTRSRSPSCPRRWTAARTAWPAAASGFTCGSASPAGTWAAATLAGQHATGHASGERPPDHPLARARRAVVLVLRGRDRDDASARCRGRRASRPRRWPEPLGAGAHQLQLGLDRLAQLRNGGGAEVDHAVHEEARGARHAAAGAALEVLCDRAGPAPGPPGRRRSGRRRGRAPRRGRAGRRRRARAGARTAGRASPRSCPAPPPPRTRARPRGRADGGRRAACAGRRSGASRRSAPRGAGPPGTRRRSRGTGSRRTRLASRLRRPARARGRERDLRAG